MSKKPGRQLKPLFYRILGGIVIPLSILLISFSFILLKREFEMQRRHYEREGKMALETFHHEFSALISDASIVENAEALQEQVEWIKKRLGAEKIDIIDPIIPASVLSPRTQVISIRNKKDEWALTREHLKNIQLSINQKRENIPHHLVIDEKEKKIYGYLPFESKKGRLYVAVSQFKLADFKKAIQETFRILSAVLVLILITAFFISYRLTTRIVRPLQAINRACREMLAGKLGHQVEVRTGDELELLAANFNKMSQALLIMTNRAEDANPLTQLPGNREITSEVERRLGEQRKFVFFHLDIDHFKAYNDHYGLARGDDVLRNTGNLLREVNAEFENQEIFIGHQGGDDFVVISSPAFADQIANALCKRFDANLKLYYTEEDLQRGYFLGEDSRNMSLSGEVEVKRQPLMSISIAGVSNAKRPYESYQEILEKAVIMKKKAKKIPYSVHLIDE